MTNEITFNTLVRINYNYMNALRTNVKSATFSFKSTLTCIHLIAYGWALLSESIYN